ncbi:CerR family C-terminal domain-containing protein [Rhizobium sp. KVB221]|uniref:CerR family C-terminal domain-containing protein n=1 Tax=Rhizobium setariae TaxID=2801340 RepID=A0A936YST1_9HYPH|nr:CerR family C-terminal domain-containing protein [Rhizobium setariae]MBL0372027.1 CerR family C-terminal domain-containing protein [Rhizobium setariae]
MDKQRSGAEVTRMMLVEAAIRLFGEKGYDAVSTREIGDLAAANIGSISYHFGGKQGLHRACAEYVISEMRAQVEPVFQQPISQVSADEALEMIGEALLAFCRLWLANAKSHDFVSFLMREIMNPGEVSELLYNSWMKPMHIRLCALFGLATGLDANSEEVKVAVFSLVGQVFHFKVAGGLLLRRLDWDELGNERADRLFSLLARNARLIVMGYRNVRN